MFFLVLADAISVWTSQFIENVFMLTLLFTLFLSFMSCAYSFEFLTHLHKAQFDCASVLSYSGQECEAHNRDTLLECLSTIHLFDLGVLFVWCTPDAFAGILEKRKSWRNCIREYYFLQYFYYFIWCDHIIELNMTRIVNITIPYFSTNTSGMDEKEKSCSQYVSIKNAWHQWY